MDVILLLVLLVSCRTEAVGAQMELAPSSLTVLRGDEARFSCSTSSSVWTVMVWLLNGRAVLTVSKQDGALPTPYPNITADKCPNSKLDCWVLVLNNTERNNQGQVTCDLQLIDIRTATLFVQEKGIVTVLGGDRLAFKNDSVLFQCRAAGWFPEPALQWQLNGKKVSPAEYSISAAAMEKSLFTVSSNYSVTAKSRSQVDCLASVSALNTPLKSSVHLTVVVVQEEGGDCTVLVGLTATFAALLLLVLLSFCAALCYRRMRKPKKNPQEVTRQNGALGENGFPAEERNSTELHLWSHQSAFGPSSVAEATGGKVNLGFSTEDPTDVHSCDVINGAYNQMSFETFHTVPDVVHSRSVSLHTESQTTEFQEEETNTIRRITTV
ncbi:immunoglobulin superfamily member 5 [Kryptolebias marmoratus]|uniref:immunoglobulin superfamily member 5 n=1 Tax=Kryptolebias marmoratus TaxID=37003 RepID=UPI0007F89348|nr:immunoglobulin superfamily member 5 [Kryptolebias marmoratus]XP_024862522.1 immunoglobulin superfamily member 5 [Kryptolebias marmoratus]